MTLPEDVRERQYTFRDILGFLNDQQYYTDDDGHICISGLNVALELDKMFKVETISAKAEGANERLNLQHTHEAKLYLFKNKEVFNEYMAAIRAEAYADGVKAMREAVNKELPKTHRSAPRVDIDEKVIDHCADQLLNPPV